MSGRRRTRERKSSLSFVSLSPSLCCVLRSGPGRSEWRSLLSLLLRPPRRQRLRREGGGRGEEGGKKRTTSGFAFHFSLLLLFLLSLPISFALKNHKGGALTSSGMVMVEVGEKRVESFVDGERKEGGVRRERKRSCV